MANWTTWTITSETQQKVMLRNTGFEEYRVEMKEGSGISLTLFTGMQAVTYSNLGKGAIYYSRPELQLRKLEYTLSRTQGHTEPFEVVVGCRTEWPTDPLLLPVG